MWVNRHRCDLSHLKAALWQAFAVLVWLCIALPALAQPYDIFAPPPASEAADFEAALKSAGILSANQTIAALPADQQAAIRAIRNAQTAPSMATSVAVLSHFPTFADKQNDLFRRTMADVAMPALLMADAAKYELILQTNRAVHAQEKSAGNADGIAVSLRVGSTGLRFAQWQQWVAAGRPMDGTWTFKDPFDPTKSTTFTGMPIDDTYRDAKLLAADDDVTNWASEKARLADPLANERLNGKRAADEFTRITAEELARLPPEMQDSVRGGKAQVAPGDMMVEFLSPTQAHTIMGDEARRTAKGWQAPIDLRTIHFLGAWVHADPEKYNGLFAEEQLHAWGMAKGFVTENVDAPFAEGSTKTYKESATSGVLKDITGADVFPKGVKDPFGWMATNYRQIFVTHEGDLDSLAKYSERMIDWWKSVNLSGDELRQLAQDSPGIRPISPAEFDKLEKLSRDIRNAPDADAKAAAIASAGGKDAAIGLLKDLNQAMMITGQRKHLQQLAGSATSVLQIDATSRTLEDRLETPLSFEEIIAEAERRRKAGSGESDPYVAFLTSINAYANGYANLPAEVAQSMAADIAHFVQADFLRPNGEGQIEAEMRLQLLGVMERGAERARAVGTDVREDAAGLARFADLAKSDLGEQISKKLVDLGEPDLHGYLRKILQGQVTRRKYWLLPDTEGGWPRVKEVDQIWRPADIGNDLKRIMWLGKTLGWTDADFAARLAAYVNGPEYRVPSAPLPDGVAVKRSYADQAIDAYLAFSRLFEKASSTTHFVRMSDADGNEITRQVSGMNFGDQAANTGAIAFEHTLRGAEAMAKVWSIKGDVDSMQSFAKNLHAFTLGNPDQTDADRARAFATMTADAYGLFPSLVEKFGSNEWNATLERHIGKNSTVLGKAGGTIGAALQNADNAFQTPEAQEALYGAIVTDLAVAWQPHVATAMAIHAMYKAGSTYVYDAFAKSDLITLLARNGDWEFPTNGQPPKLKALHLGDVVIVEDAAARKQQCILRAQSSFARDDKAKTGTVGIEKALRILPELKATGVPLCEKIEDGKCLPATSAQSVDPRAAALQLFKSSGLDKKDPILIPIRDSINAMVGWEYLDALRRAFFDDGTEWTAKRLASQGIYPPTPEDASFVLREKVEIKVPPSEMATWPRDAWIHADVWRSLKKGGRKMLGYMASEYWVRRQYLMECVMLDQWITAAALQAQKDDFKGIEIGDVADKLAGLDRRMRALDAKVWKAFAASYQPYPLELDGAAFPDDQRLAIYQNYLEASVNPRRDLRDIIAWFEGEQRPDNVPEDVLGRAVARQLLVLDAAEAPTSGRDMVMQSSEDEAAYLRKSQEMLLKRVETLLSDITDLVGKYEKGFEDVLKRVTAIEKYVAKGDKFRIAPVHVAIMGVGTYQAPGGKYGPVEKHLFPNGSWTTDEQVFKVENELLASVNISDRSFAVDGTVGAALREWENGYKTALADARDAVARRMQVFQTTLVAEKHGFFGTVKPEYTDKTHAFEVMVGLPDYELARDHPLFPRILRQTFQAHKAELVTQQAERVSEAELSAVVANFRTDGPKGEKPKAKDIAELKALGTGFDDMAGALIALTSDLFEIVISGDTPTPHFVGNTITRDYAAKPHAREGIPEITAEDIKKWTDIVYWEIARNPEFTGPVQRVGLDPGRDIAFPADLLPRDGGTVPPLMTCDADVTDHGYENRIAVLPGGKDHKLHLPMISPGVFFLRATAMSRSDVPLARKEVRFQIAPAELRGALNVTGGQIDSKQGQMVEVHVGGLPWRKLIGKPDSPVSLPDKYPVVILHRDGLFRTQLCGALSQIMLNPEPVPPTLIPASEAARNLETVGFFFPHPGATADKQIESATVMSIAMEPGVFGLSTPVEIILDAAEAVAVSVVAKDASDREVAPSASEILLPRETVPGPGPATASIKEADEVSATAEMAVLGGVVSAQSEPVAFSVRDHSAGLTLELDLPGYAKGNLKVMGEFVIPKGMEEYGGISGGKMWSNLLPYAGQSVVGARFGFANDAPVALSNGMMLETLLYANDAVETYLTGIVPALAELPTGGQLDLGEIDVSVLMPKPVDLVVALKDWTGTDLAGLASVDVSLDGTPMEVKGNRFVTTTSFRGRRQTRVIKVVYTLDSTDVSVEHEISADIVGNPLAPRDPAPITIRVPLYEPGNLRVVGVSEFVDAEFSNQQPPARFGIGFQSKDIIDTSEGIANARFEFTPGFAVPVGAHLQVEAKTRIGRHSLKGVATGTASPRTGGAPKVLDMGRLIFEEFQDFIPMPKLIGMNIDDAEAQFGGDFTFVVHRARYAPTEAEIDIIHVQAPLPHLAGQPSLVPVGMTVALGVYRDPGDVLVSMPDVTGKSLRHARAMLGATSPDLVINLAAGRAGIEGEPTEMVLAQIPPAETKFDPRAQTISLTVTTAATANVVPESDPPPEPEPPEPDPGPKPEASGELLLAGDWVGNFRITYVDFFAEFEGDRIDITCREIEPCQRDFIQQMVTVMRKMLKEMEQQEAAQSDADALADMADIGGAVAEAAVGGMMGIIVMVVAVGSIPVIDILFTGLDYGMTVTVDETAGISVQFPDGGLSLNEYFDAATKTVNDKGDLHLSLNQFSVDDQGVVDLDALIEQTDTGLSLTANLKFTVVGEPVHGEVTLEGDMVRGTPDMTPLWPQLEARIKQEIDNLDKNPDTLTLLKPIYDLAEEMGMSMDDVDLD